MIPGTISFDIVSIKYKVKKFIYLSSQDTTNIREDDSDYMAL